MIVKNLEASGAKKTQTLYAEMILTFNSGLCLEQNIPAASEVETRIQEFMGLVRTGIL